MFIYHTRLSGWDEEKVNFILLAKETNETIEMKKEKKTSSMYYYFIYMCSYILYSFIMLAKAKQHITSRIECVDIVEKCSERIHSKRRLARPSREVNCDFGGTTRYAYKQKNNEN
jgi:hypothetical protein